MVVKMNFTLPEAVVQRLKAQVRERERSAFVAEAVQAKLTQMESARLELELAEGYQVTAREGAAVDAAWAPATLESSPADDDDQL